LAGSPGANSHVEVPLLGKIFYVTGLKVSSLKSRQLLIRGLVAFLIVASCLRVLITAVDYGLNELQMDFSAFFTAGEALNNGYSPYKNNVVNTPPVWDGVAVYDFSRFLYPPITATLFRPLALLPYSAAKLVWLAFTLGCLALSLFVWLKTFNLPGDKVPHWQYGFIFVAFFFPLYPFIERGQIDSVTMLVLNFSFFLMLKHPKMSLLSGILLALATVLKLNCIFFVPFLFLRRRLTVVTGFIIGSFILLSLSFLLNGVDNTLNYARVDFPRISRLGENGTDEQLLPREVISNHLAGTPAGYTIKQAQTYLVSTLNFDGQVSLTQLILFLVANFDYYLNQSFVSLLIFLGFFLLVLVREKTRPRESQALPLRSEFLFWQLVMIIVLLASPLTWVMNLVWLCPLFFLFLYYLKNKNRLNNRYSLLLILAGLILIAVPDHFNLPLLSLRFDGLHSWDDIFITLFVYKYQFGQILLATALLLEYVKRKTGDSTEHALQSDRTDPPASEPAPLAGK
jgi:hypothetical protein